MNTWTSTIYKIVLLSFVRVSSLMLSDRLWILCHAQTKTDIMFKMGYTEKEVISWDTSADLVDLIVRFLLWNFYIETQCGNRLGQEVIDMKGFSPASSSSVLIVSLKFFNSDNFSRPTYFRGRLLCTTWGRAEWFFWSPGKPSNPRIHPLICSW